MLSSTSDGFNKLPISSKKSYLSSFPLLFLHSTMPLPLSYSLFPLGDAGVLVDFGNEIDEAINKRILHVFQLIKNDSLPYIRDVIPAYSSLAVYYDTVAVLQNKKAPTAFEPVAEEIKSIIEKEKALNGLNTEKNGDDASINSNHRIPVCY